MVNKSTTNVSTNQQDKNGEQTVAILNDGGNKNSSDLALKTGYQRPSSREDIDNFFITEQTFWERVFSWRSFMVALLHLTFILNALPVVTMSMALMCMCGPNSKPTNDSLNNSSLLHLSTYTEFTPLENKTAPQEKVYEFNWDSETRGLLITSYMFTYFMAPQLCNIVRSYIGNKLTMTLFTVALAFISFVSPIAARTNVYIFLAIRIVSGFCININFPISVDTLAWWIPVTEKLTSTTIVNAGVICVVWTIAWHFLSSRKPENHSYISEEEKTYILAGRVGMNHAVTKGADSIPYRTILTSRPVLAFIASHVLHLWALSIFFSCLPLYLASVLKFPLAEAGSVFSVLFFTRIPGIFFWSTLGNWLRDRKHLSTNNVRKISCGLGQGAATISCFTVSFLDENHKWLATVMVGVAMISISYGSTMRSLIPLDMAPRYAGYILGITQFVACLISITAPLAATAIAKEGLFEQWRVVWICMSLTNLTSGLAFILFGNASLQIWAVPEIVPTIVKVNDQSSSDLTQSNDLAATSLQPYKPGT